MNDTLLLLLVPIAAFAAFGGPVRRAIGRSDGPLDYGIVVGGLWSLLYATIELTGVRPTGLSPDVLRTIWISGVFVVSLLHVMLLRRSGRAS